MLRLALLAILALGCFCHEKSTIIHHHSLEAPYIADWWQEGVPHWDIGGATVVTDSFVRLTPQRASQFGWIWNHLPNESPEWEMVFTFHVRSKRNPGADGMAFWYVETPYKEAKGGELFGMSRQFKGIGVIFDSYDNDNRRDNPMIHLVTNLDGHKNVWNLESDLMEDTTVKCLFDYRNRAPEDPTEIVLSYYEGTLRLLIRSQMRQNQMNCGELRGIDIPVGYHFGATAQTGHLVDNHDVIAMNFRVLGEGAAKIDGSSVEAFDHAAENNEKTFWHPQKGETQRHG